MKVALIGKGHVGSAIAKGLTSKGHEVKFGHRNPKEPVFEAAKWGEIIFLAVPFDSISEAVKKIGSAADGKPVVDVTNVIDQEGDLAIGFSTSGAEELQKKMPKAFVVKAFNTVFASNQSNGRINSEQLTLFVAGDQAKAKDVVMRLGRDIGFEPVDAGPLKNARYLEPMAMLIIDLGYGLGMGTNIGYRLVKG
ncbi:MAG TPA: NADPH-dependent F420 reductase [Candidatus Nanoarchaeia archaeon]|nr:NADPH-dependent F420 reductase [Candidatus Nanoarchaeia archaeon]